MKNLLPAIAAALLLSACGRDADEGYIEERAASPEEIRITTKSPTTADDQTRTAKPAKAPDRSARPSELETNAIQDAQSTKESSQSPTSWGAEPKPVPAKNKSSANDKAQQDESATQASARFSTSIAASQSEQQPPAQADEASDVSPASPDEQTATGSTKAPAEVELRMQNQAQQAQQEPSRAEPADSQSQATATASQDSNQERRSPPSQDQSLQAGTDTPTEVDASTDETVTVILNEEEFSVGKEQVAGGGVLIRKIVTQKDVSSPVQLRTEEIVIERLTPEEAEGRVADAGTNAFESQEFFIPLSSEVAVVNKNQRVHEIVRIQKQVQTEEKTIEDTVRREELEIIRDVKESAQGGQQSVESGTQQGSSESSNTDARQTEGTEGTAEPK